MNKLVIEIPGLPPVVCSPNYRAHLHWGAKYRAASDYGATVFYAAVDARNRSGSPETWKNLDNAHVSVTFVLANHRRRDLDNLIASMKSGIDSLVRCGILKDDSAGHVTMTYKAEFGDEAMTVIEIEEAQRA